MAVLSDLEPAKVFEYFEEICSIPHGSKNTLHISNYLVDFAQSHNLRYIQDSANNVIIFKDGSDGYQQSAPVMLQGHMDMVCEKEANCSINFDRDGLELMVKDGAVTANGTTLGGDDGIAIAYALAILESDTIPHPPLECVFTVDEEIGMLGAAALDCSPLKSRIMLNLDSEDEGYLLVSCAGGISATCHIPYNTESIFGSGYTISISGLKGGHSGVEIDKGRGNANNILGRVLYELKKECDFNIATVSGGLKDNAIPRQAQAIIATSVNYTETDFIVFTEKMNYMLAHEYSVTDPDINVSAEKCLVPANVADKAGTNSIITALFTLPWSIQKMSFDIKGLVESSLNPGILNTTPEEFTISFAIRSSVTSEKEEMLNRVTCLTEALGGYVTTVGDYPGWEYKTDSMLRKLMIKTFKDLYGKDPIVQALHAGVECGLFSSKLNGLDCVSFGPDMTDIHTTSESLNIDSVKRTWEYTLEVLKRLK